MVVVKQITFQTKFDTNGFLVFKETVVLRRWESETKVWFNQTS